MNNHLQQDGLVDWPYEVLSQKCKGNASPVLRPPRQLEDSTCVSHTVLATKQSSNTIFVMFGMFLKRFSVERPLHFDMRTCSTDIQNHHDHIGVHPAHGERSTYSHSK